MMKIRATIIWNPVKRRWDMEIGGHFVMDFPNCKNFVKIFDEPSKGHKNVYTIDVTKGISNG